MPEVILLMVSLLHILRVVLKQLVSISIVIEYQLLEHLHEVVIGIGVTLLDPFQFGLH